MSGEVIDLLDSSSDNDDAIIRDPPRLIGGSQEAPLTIDASDSDSSVEQAPPKRSIAVDSSDDEADLRQFRQKQEARAGGKTKPKLEYNEVDDERKVPAVVVAKGEKETKQQSRESRAPLRSNQPLSGGKTPVQLIDVEIAVEDHRILKKQSSIPTQPYAAKPPARKQPYSSNESQTRQQKKPPAQAAKPLDVHDSDSDSSDDENAAQNLGGTCTADAICLPSTDDDESEQGWEGDCIRRPETKRMFASKFAQLASLSSAPKRQAAPPQNRRNNRQGLIGRSARARQDPTGVRLALLAPQSTLLSPDLGSKKLRKGQRKIGGEAEAFVPLGRKGSASRLSRSIKNRRQANRKRPPSPEAESSDESRASTCDPLSPKTTERSRKSLSDIRQEGSTDIEESEPEEIDGDGENSKLSTGSAGTGRTGADASVSYGWPSDDDQLEIEISDSRKVLASSTLQLSNVSEGLDPDKSVRGALTAMAIKPINAADSDIGLETGVSKESLSNEVSVSTLIKTQSNTCASFDARKIQKDSLAQVSTSSLEHELDYTPDIVENAQAAGGIASAEQETIAFISIPRKKRQAFKSISRKKQIAAGEDWPDSLDRRKSISKKKQITAEDDWPDSLDRRKSISRKKQIVAEDDSSDSLDKRLAFYDPLVRIETQEKRGLEEREKSPTTPPTPTLETEDITEEKAVMNSVPHLSKTTYNSKGLPFHRFTVHTNNDESILYDFEVKIKPSEVAKNSGLGAFLIFRGARVLGKERLRLNQKKMQKRQPVDPGTLEKLEARNQDGSVVVVTLVGKHLHGHNNSIWRTPTEMPLRAVNNEKSINLRLLGKNLHYDIDEDERLGLDCCSKGIGHLFMNTESDYVHDRSIVFSAKTVGNCAFFELGRYGPARKEDRKRKVDFDTKSFLFDLEPSGWCFGVDEPLLGCDQIVDITDDGTGEPHQDARKNPAIYVNEVGHNAELVSNVYPRLEGSTVHYYVDINHPMKKEDEVELLGDYKSHYEPTRERKGYGSENLVGKEKSDYDISSKLQRNFAERVGMEEMIEALTPLELFYNLEFISTRILPEVDNAARNLFSTDSHTPASSQALTPRQLIARRRLHWLAPMYLQRTNAIQASGSKLGEITFDVSGKAVGEAVGTEMRTMCQEWAELVKWSTLLGESQPPPIADQKLKVVFESETVEEVLYYIRDHFQHPMDVNLFCPIARDLTVQLCVAAFQQLRLGRQLCREVLATAFLECASKAADSIRKAINSRSYADLAFCSGAEGSWRVKGSPKDLVTLAAGTALSNSTVLKGAVSSLLDIQAYQDLVNLGLMEPRFDVNHMERTCDEPVVITSSPLGSTTIEGMPRRIDFVSQQHGAIHEKWYLIWQNVHLVHAIFTGLMRTMSTTPVDDQRDAEFLNELCRTVSVDVDEQARIAIKAGIRTDLASPQMSFTSRASLESKPKRTGRKKKAASLSVRAAKPKKSRKVGKPKEKRVKNGAPGVSKQLFVGIIWKALTGLGWTLNTGNRPTDFYFLPTGVRRGKEFGFRNRIDFFDSHKLVLGFIKNDPRWKEKEEVRESISLYEGCQKFLTGRKIKGQFKLDTLIEHVKKK